MVHTIPITLIELEGGGFHPLVEAELPGGLIVNLLLDTGASQSVFDTGLPAEVFRNFKDAPDNNSFGINAQHLEIRLARLDFVRLGEFVLFDYDSPVMDLSSINRLYLDLTGIRFGGLLGSDFFNRFGASLHYRKKQLVLRSGT